MVRKRNEEVGEKGEGNKSSICKLNKSNHQLIIVRTNVQISITFRDNKGVCYVP